MSTAIKLDDSLLKQVALFKEYGIDRPYVSFEEAANVLGVHLNTLRKAVDEKRLKISRFSANTVRVSVSELAEFADSDYVPTTQKQPNQSTDLPGRINFAVRHEDNRLWPVYGPLEEVEDGLNFRPGPVLIENLETKDAILSGLTVCIRAVVCSKPFKKDDEDSYEAAVEWLRQSHVKWEADIPLYGSASWSTETLMPDIIEPSLREGGYTLVPHFNRDPQSIKRPGTFLMEGTHQLIWLPQHKLGGQFVSRLSIEGNVDFISKKTRVPKLWYGAIILDWITSRT